MQVGDLKLFVGVLRDLTLRKGMEKKLQQAERMQAVGLLAGGIAHDFNNLLTAIIGNVELVQDLLKNNETALSHIKVIERAANRGADLTQRLLSFSRKQTLRPESTDANKLISNLNELLHRTIRKDIQIETILASGLWDCMVDPSPLDNVLLNLAINASDAMPSGGKLTIETANSRLDQEYADLHEEVTPGQYVMIAVSDTGTGIDEDVIDYILEPFFTTKGVGKGTGLGLSMAYGFVKQSGGHLKIYSEIDKGTTVKIYLPRTTSDIKNPGLIAAHVPVQPIGNETILVVEDDLDVRQFIVTALTVIGYKIYEAEDGPSALTILDKIPHLDLLFTDVVLPNGMTGRTVAEEIKKKLPNIKVLYMSGYTENSIVHHGKIDPGIEFLSKPYTRQKLAKTIRSTLDKISS